MTPYRALLLLIVAALAVAAAHPPARADDAAAAATDGEVPAPRLDGPGYEVAVYEGKLTVTDHRFELRLRGDGTAKAVWVATDPAEDLLGGALTYTGRWRSAPFSVRLDLDRTAPYPPSRDMFELYLRGRTDDTGKFSGEHRLRVGRWIAIRNLRRTAGASVDAVGVTGATVLQGAAAAFALEADRAYVSTHTDRLLVSLRLRNRGDRPLGSAKVRFTLPKGEVRTAIFPVALEPSEGTVVVDHDLGALPKGMKAQRIEAVTVEARGASASAGSRLRGLPMAHYTELCEVLFAWPGSDDHYEVLLRNNSEDALGGIVLDLRYTDLEGRTLEHLPVPLEQPLAPGEVRYLHRIRGQPRGADEQPYFLHDLDRVMVTVSNAHPVQSDRLGGSAREIYDDLTISKLSLDGDRFRPTFLFDVTNRTTHRLEKVAFVLIGTDAKKNIVACVHAPLAEPRHLAPGASRSVRFEADAIYGISNAVLTWTVVPGGLELAKQSR